MRINKDNYTENFSNKDMDFLLYSTMGDRKDQQDSAGYELSEDEGLIVICDGMGGHKGGRLASDTAIEELLGKYNLSDHSQIKEVFQSEAERIDGIIHEFEEDGKPMKAGTTMVAVYIRDGGLRWLSVGDSRIYILRNEELVQATVDQNYSLLLHMKLSKQQISKAQFDDEMNKGEGLISFLGVGGLPIVDINEPAFKLMKGDRILLTTDGLYKMVPDEDIRGILANFNNINDAKNALSDKAKMQSKRTGKDRDNITFAIIEIK